MGIMSIVWSVDLLSRAVAAVFAGHVFDSVLSCRSTTFVPSLVLWLRFAQQLEPSV